MLNFKSIKLQLIIFLSGFAVYLSIVNKHIMSLAQVLLCALMTLSVEAGFAVLRKKKPVFSESAVITGLILGFVLAGGQPWYIYGAATLLAIGSKQLIRFHNKHIFNPAAFGILAAVMLLKATTQWQGTYLWYILAPAGLYFIYRIRKMELLISYLIVALGLFGAQALKQQVPLKYIFGYLSYFFIFIMLIEPKTTPVHRMGKIIFGGLVAILIFLLTQAGVRFDAELASLLIANATVPLLNQKQQKKGA